MQKHSSELNETIQYVDLAIWPYIEKIYNAYVKIWYKTVVSQYHHIIIGRHFAIEYTC